MVLNKLWSPGKIMLTGEYLVLQGAKSLALPTVLGQSLDFSVDKNRKTKMVNWKSKMPGNEIWYSNQFLIDSDFSPNQQIGSQRTVFIQSLLRAINTLKPEFFKDTGVYTFNTFLDFDPGWGLGSSSSLIANLALLTDLQPFEILFHSSLNQGSGYDVAVCYMAEPITYFIEESIFHWAEPVELNWKQFASDCRLIYLNRKQDSNTEVTDFKSKWEINHGHNVISEITEITEKIIACTTKEEFCSLLNQHELILSEVLKKKTIKEEFFKDYNGTIKSLGAWGGDFILACSEHPPEYTESYFMNKGYQVIIDFGKMIDYEWKE